jgi:hypothetical protein
MQISPLSSPSQITPLVHPSGTSEQHRKEREGLNELIDKDFGLLELAMNAGRDVKKNVTAFLTPRYSWIRLMAKMTGAGRK